MNKTDEFPNEKINARSCVPPRKPRKGLKDFVTIFNKTDQRKKNSQIYDPNYLTISSDASMERIMQEIIKKYKIDSDIWQMSRNKQYYQITFFIDTIYYRCQMVMNILKAWGIGERNGSCVSVMPCTVFNRRLTEETECDTKQ